jgi:hypothetical protein
MISEGSCGLLGIAPRAGGGGSDAEGHGGDRGERDQGLDAEVEVEPVAGERDAGVRRDRSAVAVQA